jgi:hypothetical protein
MCEKAGIPFEDRTEIDKGTTEIVFFNRPKKDIPKDE